MQLNINRLFIPDQAEAGKYLFVKVGLEVGQLLFLYGRIPFEHQLLIIYICLINGIKKRDDFQVIRCGIPPHVQFEIALFSFFKGLDEQKEFVGRPVRHRNCLSVKSLPDMHFGKIHGVYTA
jgi:hypothetical protein